MIIKIIFFAALALATILALIIIDNKFLGRRFHTLLVFPEEYFIYKYIINNQNKIEKLDSYTYKVDSLIIEYITVKNRTFLWVTRMYDPENRILFSYYNEYYAKKLAKILDTKIERIIC